MANVKQKSLIALALIFILCLVAGLTVAFSGVTAKADGEFNRTLSVTGVEVNNGAKSVKNVKSDPVVYYDESSGGYLNNQEIRYSAVSASESVIYTALYPRTTTGRTGDVAEFVCEPDGADYKVTEINTSGDGTTYIPVGGFVLSLPKSNASFAKAGDTLTLGGTKLNITKKAVESSSGARIAVDNTNTTRSGRMVVYYDYQFGQKTGTNVFGTEMTCTFDFEENTFKVVSFRGFGVGDDSGSDIPDNSFVLSAYGEGYRGLLVKNELFKVGDEVKMMGFDFIRFGGTVYGSYDYINPTKEGNPGSMETSTSPFPAYRGNNQTIIYTSGWSYNGANGTGTNVYGFEAAVNENGVVVELGVNVTTIPVGGYVISGHGTGRDFIRSNVVIGATVSYDETTKTYSVSTTLNSYYENLVSEANAAISSAKEKISRLYDIDAETINGLVTEVEAELASLKTVKEDIEAGIDSAGWTEEQRLSRLMNYNLYQIRVENLFHKILTLSLESKPVSARATWHRPTEKTYSALEQTISMYADVGINLVFVETLYNGYSAFRSEYNDLFPYNLNMFGASYTAPDGTKYDDYLTAFTAICKKYGIEVHAWVEDFYVGTMNTVPAVKDHPDWILYNDDGTIYQRNEGGSYIFLDPANKEVCDALINYYKDLLDKVPDIAGLNLDYIRYPVSSRGEDTGYTVAAMQGFADLKGLTFSDAQKADRQKMANKFKQLFDKAYLAGGQAEADKNFEDWVTYRAGIVTDYVKRIKTEIKDEKGILLSTAVFSSVSESLNNKKQDWKTWFANGWIDIATPMAYYNDSSDVLSNVNAMILAAGNNCYYYAGLASSYSGLPAYRNTDQIEAAYLAGANGYVIFCSTQIVGHSDVQEVLKDGANAKAGVLPHADTQKILKAYFDDILDKAERLYIPAGGMNAEKFAALSAKFAEISAMNTEGAINIQKIRTAISGIYSKISPYASGYSGQRVSEQLKELNSLLDTKISLALISSGDWNPEENRARPTVTDTEIIPVTPVTPDPPAEENPEDPPAVTPGNSNTGSSCGSTIDGGTFILTLPFIAAMAAVLLIRKNKKNKNKS